MTRPLVSSSLELQVRNVGPILRRILVKSLDVYDVAPPVSSSNVTLYDVPDADVSSSVMADVSHELDHGKIIFL